MYQFCDKHEASLVFRAMKKFTVRAACLLVVLALVLAACGSDDSGDSSSSTTETTTKTATATTETTPTTPTTATATTPAGEGPDTTPVDVRRRPG